MKKIILRLTGLKLIASLIGLVYSVLQVRFFGASAEMDAYFVAMSAVYMITSLIQGGQLSEVFLPIYLKQKLEFGAKTAHNLLSSILNRMMIVVLLLLTLLYFIAPYIISLIGPGLDAAFQELSIQLFSISLILIFFTLIGSFVNTTLNAEQIYGRAELTALINGFVSIGVLYYFYKDYGVFTLIYALLAGKVIEFLISLYFLKKIGYRYRLIWHSKEYDVTSFFKVMVTTSGYVGATQLYSVTITAMASFLPVGSLSIFNYVKQLSSKASSILMGPISTVFFSKFSVIVTEGKKNLADYLKKPLSYIFVLTFMIFALIFLIGYELLSLLWSEKGLSTLELKLAYIMLCLNFFGFIFSATGAIFRKAAIALERAKQLYKGWIKIQLFCALYALVSIYFFGIYGLISILVINMILMALTSFYVMEQTKVKTKSIIFKLLINKKSIFLLSIIIIATILMKLGLEMLTLGDIYNILIKSFTLAFVTFLLIKILYKSDLKELINSIKKR